MDLEGMGLDDINQNLRAIHGTLIAIAAGLEGITLLLIEDLKSRDPDAFERVDQQVRKKSKEWLQMIREVN